MLLRSICRLPFQLSQFINSESVLNPFGEAQGVSLHGPTDRAIRAPQFRDVDGAYSLLDRNALAKAIMREYRFPKADSGT